MFASSDLTGIPLSNRQEKMNFFDAIAKYFMLQITVSELYSQLLDWEY